MTDPIRWGVLGASDFARQSMVPALHGAAGSCVVALATRDRVKAAPFCQIVPDLRVEDGYDALLRADDVDAIYVPLPNHLHVEWTIRALEAGKHVLCEKPAALSATQFDDLIAARDASGQLAAEAFMIVHHPQWKMARDVIQRGALRRLRHVDVSFSFDNRDPENIRNIAKFGGGGLRDIGIYAFGSVRFATGAEPERLDAVLEMEQGFDTFAEVSARFPDFSFHAVVSTRIAPRQRVVFHGEGGVMELTAPFNAGVFDQAELVLETEENARTVHRWPGVNQYLLQVQAFCESARSGADYPWTLEQARGSQRMIDMALAAGGAEA